MKRSKHETASKLQQSFFAKLQSSVNAMKSTKLQARRNKTTNVSQYSVLEPRNLLASVTFSSGVITIDGTTENDNATVSISGSNVAVTQPGFDTESFAASSVTEIVFIGRAGDDLFENTTSIPSSAFGQAGNDTLIGGSGDDDLRGNVGNDFIDGRGGADQLRAGNGDDEVNGGTGNDRIFGNAGTNTLRGEAGDDAIFGGNDVDTISGGDGDDALSGNGADDIIRGGDGNDTVTAGPGNDDVDGEGGNDKLYGQAGDDEVVGGAGSDTVAGNGGNDTLRGGTGDDFLSAGTGDDELFGEAGNDRLFVIAGNNTLSGGSNSAADDPSNEAGSVNANGALQPTYRDLAIFTGFESNFQIKSGQSGGLEVIDFRDTTTADGSQVATLGDRDIVSSDVENFFFTEVSTEVVTAGNAINVDEAITVRPIIASNSNGSNTAEFLGTAAEAADIQVRIDRIFSQAGIDVVWEANRAINDTFVNVGSGGGTRTTADLDTIVTRGDSSGLGSSNANVVDAYFVERVPGFAALSDNNANGLAFQSKTGVAVHVGDNLVSFEEGRAVVARVIAHEIGHNLGLAHVGGTNNLLTTPSSTDLLTTAQQTTILSSTISRTVATSATSVEVDLLNEDIVRRNVSSPSSAQVDSSTSSVGGCGGCGFCAACTGGMTLS